jgi:16S rRNA (guanine1516-N2)-methyltransferase
MLVTTSDRATAVTRARALALGALPGLRHVDRASWDRHTPALVVSRPGLRIGAGGRLFRWHPGLLHTRLEAGWSHPLVRAAGLRRGDRVLDSSLGLGTDAAFLSRLTGRTVVAVEAVAGVALMTAEGLARAGEDVAVVHADGTTFLAGLPEGAVDVVQGDPMFPPGGGRTDSLAGLRLVARQAPMDRDWLVQARRVARRCVVMRDVHDGDLLERLGCPEILALRKGRPRYGVWRSA